MATRLWTPADMVGVTGVEFCRGNKNVTADTSISPSPVTAIAMTRPGGGTATSIVSFRDDFRPVLGSYNSMQTVLFDTATRQLDIPTKTNLPNGTGDKWWFNADRIRETRTDDRYIWGYGGSNGSGVAYKLRQGAVPYCDIGSVGYAVGSVAVAATGISILSEYYTAADTTSRARYNGNSTWTSYVRSRNTSTSNAAHFGNWPLYGNGSSHDLLARAWGYGTPSADDWARLEGWASWDSGDNGASLVDGHAYKTVAPTVSDGSGGTAAPDSATQAQTATSPTFASRAGVQPDSASQSATASSPTLTSRSTVTPDNATQASPTSSPSLVSRSAVTPDGAAQQQTATSPELTSRGTVTPDSATQATQASSPTISNVQTSVAPNSAAQSQIVTQPSLAGAGTVAVDSATQAQTASSPTVATRSAVQPASATQAQATTSPSLNGRQIIAPDSAAQTTLLSSPTVTSRATLTPNSASQQQAATSPTLAAKAVLLVSSALQTQTATSPALFVGERPLPPTTRTVRSIRLSRIARSPRPSRLAA